MRAVSKRSSCTSAPTYPLSPINAAVVISQFHVLHIIEVKYAGLGQVIEIYQPTQSANCVKFVPKVIFMLRGTEAEVGSLHEPPLSVPSCNACLLPLCTLLSAWNPQRRSLPNRPFPWQSSFVCLHITLRCSFCGH